MGQLRKNIQIVFQDLYGFINLRFTIGQALLEVVKSYPVSLVHRLRVQVLLKDGRLSEDTNYRYPHGLSDGQRQRACMTRLSL